MPPRRTKRPLSPLDGIDVVAIEHDAEAQLYATLGSLAANIGDAPPLQVIGILPWTFHGRTPGYLVVTYDRAKDPRAR